MSPKFRSTKLCCQSLLAVMSGHDNASSAPQTDPAQRPKKAGVEMPRQNKVIPDYSIASTVPQNELQLDQDQ